MFDDRAQKRRELDNALSAITNAIWTMRNRNEPWDVQIKGLQEIAKLIPLCIRYMLYFKNTERK